MPVAASIADTITMYTAYNLFRSRNLILEMVALVETQRVEGEDQKREGDGQNEVRDSVQAAGRAPHRNSLRDYAQDSTHKSERYVG